MRDEVRRKTPCHSTSIIDKFVTSHASKNQSQISKINFAQKKTAIKIAKSANGGKIKKIVAGKKTPKNKLRVVAGKMQIQCRCAAKSNFSLSAKCDRKKKVLQKHRRNFRKKKTVCKIAKSVRKCAEFNFREKVFKNREKNFRIAAKIFL